MTIYNGGLDKLRDITTLDLRWILLKGAGYSFNKDHDFVADLTPASNEVTVAGYARDVLTTPTRTVNDTSDRIVYGADNPNFGTLTTGESVTGIVLYQHVTVDADSILIGYWSFTALDTAAIDPFIVFFTNGEIAYVDEA